MSALTILAMYGVMAVTFLTIDLVWIGVIANRFYQKHLGFMLRENVKWTPALAFYVLFIAGVLIFAVLPGFGHGSLARTVLLGGFLGLLTYGTYDLTNLALTKGFPSIVALVDMAWGTGIAATIAAVGYGTAKWLGG